MFTIKICGVTNVSDGLEVARAGGDAIGLNFYPRSLRFVETPRAAAICLEMPASLAKVGVFVNAGPAKIREIVALLKLDFVQLHGNEDLAVTALLDGIPFLKALRINDGGLAALVDLGQQWLTRGAAAIVLDAPQPTGEYGGSGRTPDWAVCKQFVSQVDGRVILAGGLNPYNVRDAIDEVKPFGVDTASGVEGFPGKKDTAAVTQFVREARAALATQ